MGRRKKRKSPYLHKVRQHTRKNKTVHSYDRGKGPKPYVKRKEKRKGKGRKRFSARIMYPDASSEGLDVFSINYIDAMDYALEGRREIKAPKSVRLTKSEE